MMSAKATAILTLAVLASCGGPQTSSAVPDSLATTEQSVVTPTTYPVDIACDIGGPFSSSSAVLVVTALERTDDLVIESGDHLPSVLATFTATSDTPRDDGGLHDLKSPALLRIAPWNPFVDAEELLLAAPSEGNPLYVFVARGPVSGFPDEINQVTVAAQTGTDGLRLVNSSCSDQWQQPLKLAAKSQGGDLSVEFLTGLVAWGGAESQALTSALQAGTAQDQWLETPPGRRSLDYLDVPREFQSDYYLSGLAVDVATAKVGYLQLGCADGVIATFALQGVTGVLPVMVPQAGMPLEIRLSDDPTFASYDVVATFKTDLIDPTLGGRLTATDGSDALLATLAPLAAGELERLLGMTAAEIEELRADLLSAGEQ